MTDRELMQQALDVIELPITCGEIKREKTIAALRERLAQPAQQPLTDEEIADLWGAQIFHVTDLKLAINFVRDIEQAHGIGETPDAA